MKTLKYFPLVLVFVIALNSTAQKQEATVAEKKLNLKTYPFSDPNPVPNPDNTYYPYFRFDGFALEASEKEWKVVELENDYIKVTIFPEIGGKIWGAVEKSTGNEFIYYNSVVKFRDIAMRGAWTSGGIELNFGIIGHAPTSATPVDYALAENADGSVSCFLSATDLLTRTRWETEVNLQKDRAYFTTKTTWHNPTPLVQPYYQWMNAAYQVQGDLEFCFPGSHWIGHDGSAHDWPIDPEGRDISWYKNNSFGGSKSNHVLGEMSDHYAGYWHELEFGSGHYAPYGEKLGMKVFQWAHSRSGGIWEDLLTDDDGQYVELQSGRLFNQAVPGSTKTPFKHFGFEPHAMDVFEEIWFPILKTKGVKKANPFGVLNVEQDQNGKTVYFCPLQKTNEKLSIYRDDQLMEQYDLKLDVLKTWSVKLAPNLNGEPVKIVLGKNKLIWPERETGHRSSRPMQAPPDFDWNSGYGKFLDGQHWVFQKKYEKARESFESCLEDHPYFAPALNQLASLLYRKAEYQKALEHASASLSINSYDAEANFIYGLINKKLEHFQDARDGFSVASLTPAFRKAAYIELAGLSLKKELLEEAGYYAQKVLGASSEDIESNKIMAVIARKKGKKDEALKHLERIRTITQLDHFADFEQAILDGAPGPSFTNGVRCELPHEIFMEMALWYQDLGGIDEAVQLLELSPANPITLLHLAYLNHLNGDESKAKQYLETALDMSPDFVAPFRPEHVQVLNWASQNTENWKPLFYSGVLNWSLGNSDNAIDLFNACGDDPDVATFYLAKSALFSKNDDYDEEQDLEKALALDANQWRIYARLEEYYLSKNRSEEALAVAEKSMKKFPENNVLKYNYAKCLMADGQYSACKEVLSTTVILPSEGARYGRVTYRQSCLMEALELYRAGRYSAALRSVNSARLWPENLGVGKPFQVDERIENYVEALCLLKSGKQQQANQRFRQIVEYQQSGKPVYGSADYMYLVSLKRLDRKGEAEAYLATWEKSGTRNAVYKWCDAMIREKYDDAHRIAGQIDTKSGGTPWDPKYGDSEFELVKAISNLK
ncbi:MAG: DUF5107 domain-containing protein [Cytophagales bacterium]|nr:DUF5107 domain-containing protein [Cytophagales bacterium]